VRREEGIDDIEKCPERLRERAWRVTAIIAADEWSDYYSQLAELSSATDLYHITRHMSSIMKKMQ